MQVLALLFPVGGKGCPDAEPYSRTIPPLIGSGWRGGRQFVPWVRSRCAVGSVARRGWLGREVRQRVAEGRERGRV